MVVGIGGVMPASRSTGGATPGSGQVPLSALFCESDSSSTVIVSFTVVPQVVQFWKLRCAL